MSLQVKLLRVLEEREVVRIGGDRIINVDVRIIAATNRNIKELVEKGKFRKDLYYRINVLPLHLPPLRDRKEDILCLIDKFKKEFNGDFKISDKARDKLLSYNWDGNVRELRNYVEYFINLNKDVIDVEDLPFHEESIKRDINIDSSEMMQLIEDIGKDIRKYIFVLEELEKAYISERRVGRRSISKAANEKGIFLTEQQVRKILNKLNQYSMVNIAQGRGGTIITDKGRCLLRYLTQERMG